MTLRHLITHYLEAVSYLIYGVSLLYWMRQDKRGIIKILTGGNFLFATLIILATVIKGGNLHFYKLLCVSTAIFLTLYFYRILNKNWQKIISLIFCMLNTAYYIYVNIRSPDLPVFDSVGFVILSATIVILIFMYMHQLLSNVSEEPLSMNFDFWFVSAQLFYFLGAFFIFLTYGNLTSQLLTQNKRVSITLAWLWGFHNVLLFLSALIISGSIAWISYRNKLRLS